MAKETFQGRLACGLEPTISLLSPRLATCIKSFDTRKTVHVVPAEDEKNPALGHETEIEIILKSFSTKFIIKQW